MRSRLIMALPRLRRFAAILAGNADGRDSLLRGSLEALLERSHEYQPGGSFDRWAFSEIHARWLSDLRAHQDPMAQVRAEESLYLPERATDVTHATDADDLEAAHAVSSFLAGLPPQQRSAVLLIFGEKFSYDDAAIVLDASSDVVAARAVRALAAFVDRIESAAREMPVGGNIETLYPAGTQPSR